MKNKFIFLTGGIVVIGIAFLGYWFLFKQGGLNLTQSSVESWDYKFEGEMLFDVSQFDKNIKPLTGKFEMKGSVAYSQDGMKQRYKMDRLSSTVLNGKKTISLAVEDMDLIQDYYKKWGHIGEIKFNGLKEYVDFFNKLNQYVLQYFSDGNYIYIDDQILFKDKDIAVFLSNELVKDLVYAFMTPNFKKYLEQKNYFKKAVDILGSEQTLLYFLTGENNQYKLSYNVCKPEYVKGALKFVGYIHNSYSVENIQMIFELLGLDKKEGCYKVLDQYNKHFKVKKIQNNGMSIYKFILWDANLYYKNGFFYAFEQKFDNYGFFEIDRKGNINSEIKYNYKDKYRGEVSNLEVNIKNNKGYIKFLNKSLNKDINLTVNIDLPNRYLSGKLYSYEKKYSIVFKLSASILFDKKLKKLDFVYNKKGFRKTYYKLRYQDGKGRFVMRDGEIDSIIDFEYILGKKISVKGPVIFNKRNRWYIKKFYVDDKGWDIDILAIFVGQRDNLKIKSKGVYNNSNLSGNAIAVLGKDKTVLLVNGTLEKIKADLDYNLSLNDQPQLSGNLFFDYKDWLNYKIDMVINILNEKAKNYVKKVNLSASSKFVNNNYNTEYKISANNKNVFRLSLNGLIKKGNLKISLPKKYEYFTGNLKYKFLFMNLPDFSVLSKKDRVYQGMAQIIGLPIVGFKTAYQVYTYYEKKKRLLDREIESKIYQLKTALNLYYESEGEFPLEVGNLYVASKLKKYLSPKYIYWFSEKEFNKIYYIPLGKYGMKNAGYILAAPMNYPENCNTSITSINSLFDLARKVDYQSDKLVKMIKIDKRGDYSQGCYYVILY